MNRTHSYFCTLLAYSVAGLLLFAPVASAQNNDTEDTSYTVVTRYITQPVDHGNPDGDTFEEEVIILTPDGADAGSPVFFKLGGEGDSNGSGLISAYDAYGSPDNVIFIQAEHRGYGQSVTDNEDQSLPAYIRIEQVLADFHHVAVLLKQEFSGPWMAAGYSYSGGLVVDFAYYYPNDIEVILASSGVVQWPFLMETYDQQVKINLGEDLYARYAAHIRKLVPREPFDNIWLQREFLICLTYGISQYESYAPLIPVIDRLVDLPTPCFFGILRLLDNIVADGYGWLTAQSFGKKGLSRDEALTGKYNWYTWKYQQCSETGTFWVSENPGGMYPRSEADIIEECELMFGEFPAAATPPSWRPYSRIGQLTVPQVYTVGGKDPWKGICLSEDDAPANSEYFYAPEGYHCPDKSDPVLGQQVFAAMLSYALQSE